MAPGATSAGQEQENEATIHQGAPHLDNGRGRIGRLESQLQLPHSDEQVGIWYNQESRDPSCPMPVVLAVWRCCCNGVGVFSWHTLGAFEPFPSAAA